MKNKLQVSNGLLVILIILENLFLYYFFKKGILAQGPNAIGLFLSSVCFGLVLIYKFYNATLQQSLPPVKNIVSYTPVLLLLAGLVLFGIQYNTFFKASPVTAAISDIIPTIQVLCRRLLNGQYPYSIVNDFGYTINVTYLPMHWMPFTIAEVLHIDYRWITYGAWCIASVLLCIRSARISSPVLRTSVPLIILASFYVLYRSNYGIVDSTIELLVAGYYMMLIMGLNQQNGILQGLIISVCLLSRYSLVLWLPLYAFILFTTQNRKQLFAAVTTALIVITLIYVIPFLSKDWSLFYKGYKYYDRAALFEWTHTDNTGKPVALFSGTGIAYYFYSAFPDMDIPARIKLIQRTHLICSLSVTIIMGIWFWFKKDKIDHRIFILSSFKIYLAVFLFLIQVPYLYLMCVGNFVTIAIFCEQARYRVSN